MEETFLRIRGQVGSKLDNQKQVAITLQTVDEVLESQGQPKIASAYFGILLTLLEQDEGKLRPSIIYLLDVVFAEVSDSILKAKLVDIIKIFFTVLDEESDSAPIIKAAVGCLEVLIKAQEKTAWSHPALKKAYQYLLHLCFDSRPKLRRRAHEAVAGILDGQPSPISVTMTFDFCINHLKRIRKASVNSASNEAVPFLFFLKTISKHWTPQEAPKLTAPLMSLTKLNNNFITTLIYQTLANIFSQLNAEDLEVLLQNITSAKPNLNETEPTIAWLTSLCSGYSLVFKLSPLRFFSVMPGVFQLLFKDLEENNSKVNFHIGAKLRDLIKAYSVVAPESIDQPHACILLELFDFVKNCLTYRFRNSLPSIFSILRAMYQTFCKYNPQLLIPSIEVLDSMRLESGFEYKDEVDQTLGAAVAVLGPRLFLSVLPLNLEKPGDKTVGRAWLLPVLKDYINNTDFSYFSENLIGLSERLEVKAQDFDTKGRAIESKIYQTLVYQIWSLFPSFASFPLDVQKGFTSSFAERLAGKIYSDAELRPCLFNGLALLIESNRRLQVSSELLEESECLELQTRMGITQCTANDNLEHLKQFATNFLMVFFNVYTTASPAMRVLLLKAILTFLAITPSDQINVTFSKVIEMINPDASSTDEDGSSNCACMLDLASIMAPFVSFSNAEKLYDISVQCLSSEVVALQKRSYKILTQLLETENTKEIVSSRLEALEPLLLEVGFVTSSAASRNRFVFLGKFVESLPSNRLHVIPRLVSEAILGTKEVNEKARESAFELLVLLGDKMAKGGTIDHSLIDPDSDSAPTSASLVEYFTMVCAGLTGSTPHMISASISALSKLIFEFHEKLPSTTIEELIQTIEIFVESDNREIVKASLGFVKVIIVTLKLQDLQPHLSMLVNSVLKWSNDTKSHFKVKVRHIIERLIRLFGLEPVDSVFPEQHKKLLVNIRKRKLRAKRISKGSKPDKFVKSKSHVNAFEDALYGSESDLDDDETEDEVEPGNKRKSLASSRTYLKDDQLDDTPLDFLDHNVISRITASKPKANHKSPSSNKSAFKMSEDGRLVFADENDSDNEITNVDQNKENEDFYRQAIESKDGFTRTNKGIKFKQSQLGDNTPDSDDEGHRKKTVKSKPNSSASILGSKYKAKNASGDVKRKNQLDPYAYVPLNPKLVGKRGKKPTFKLSIMKRQ